MNGKDREYFEDRFHQMDKKLSKVHDDVLIIKTERKMERKVVAGISGSIALIASIVVRIFWR